MNAEYPVDTILDTCPANTYCRLSPCRMCFFNVVVIIKTVFLLKSVPSCFSNPLPLSLRQVH